MIHNKLNSAPEISQRKLHKAITNTIANKQMKKPIGELRGLHRINQNLLNLQFSHHKTGQLSCSWPQ